MSNITAAEAIHPRKNQGVGHRPSRTPMVIAHRGASGYRLEHTEAAYRFAIELGADAVEPDVVPTRDGVLVVRHENEISSTTDVADRAEFRNRKTVKIVDGQRISGWFTEDFTWEELSTLRCRERLHHIRAANRKYDGTYPMLRLRDVLSIVEQEQARVDRKLKVVVEVKHATYFHERDFDMARLVAREVRRAGWEGQDDRLVFEAFELGVLQDLAQIGFTSPRVFLAEDSGGPADRGQGVTPNRSFEWFKSQKGLKFLSQHVDGISVRKGNVLQRKRFKKRPVTGRFVRDARKVGLKVFVWTLRPENVFLEPGFRKARGIASWGHWQDEYTALFETGVAGVFADQPELAVAAREIRRHSRGHK